MASSSASAFLTRAAALARRGRFRVEPNPVVGCVLVRRGRIVAEGWHGGFGGPHAEAAALAEAGARAKGATAYVTLEPCAHQGKTPPCATALIRAGVLEVVYAAADPNPLTAGKGPALLRAAGIRVRKVRTPAAIARDLEPYRAHLERSRPWVVAKWAMTLDGHIASRTGDSKWISNPEARAFAHRALRATADAILVGAGTLRADDPSLTNRSGSGGAPLRVVAVGTGAVPSRARLLRDGGPTLLALPAGRRPPRGVEHVVCGRGERIDPRALLRQLHQRGVRRLLAEGGGTLLGSLFDRDLVDQVAVIVAPRIVGGADAPGAVGGRGAARMAEARELAECVHRELGGDLLLEGLIRR